MASPLILKYRKMVGLAQRKIFLKVHTRSTYFFYTSAPKALSTMKSSYQLWQEESYSSQNMNKLESNVKDLKHIRVLPWGSLLKRKGLYIEWMIGTTGLSSLASRSLVLCLILSIKIKMHRDCQTKQTTITTTTKTCCKRWKMMSSPKSSQKCILVNTN